MDPETIAVFGKYIYLHWGVTGIMAVYVLYDLYKTVWIPWKKKSDGKWISFEDYESSKKRIDLLETQMIAHDKADQEQFKAVEVAKAVQDEKNSHFIELFSEMKEGQKQLYAAVSEIKNLMIQIAGRQHQ